jgi:hypothetical protein
MKIPLILAVCMLTTSAFGETCTLETYASSWMATGTPFSVQCPSGIYTGHLVTTPARRFFRRGHMMLVFDQLVAMQSRNERDEGEIQAGRGKQIASMLMDGGVGIGTKDLTDGISGAVFKSWYMIPVTCLTLAFFSNGGDVNLKRGDKLEIVPLKR